MLGIVTGSLLGLGGTSDSARGQTATVPSLDFETIDDTHIAVSWPNVAPGFILQESDSPSEAAIWRGVAQTPTVNGARLRVPRTLDAGTTRLFYRIRKKGPNPALDYLVANQNASGLWGDPTRTGARDSAVALEALAVYGNRDDAVARAVSGVYSLSTRNNDDLARKTMGLAGRGYDVASLVTELLASQGPAVQDPAAVSYPGRGWGLAAGFGNSTIDTALGLRSLAIAGRAMGICVHREPVAANTTSAARPFVIPTGANSIVLRVRNVTGATLRMLLTPPGGGGDYYVDVPPRSSPLDVGGFPYKTGTWFLKAQNATGTAATYSAEVGFNDASGFDSFRFSSGLTFLALAQNADGGWGIATGEDSHLMLTSEVLQTLAKAGSTFVGPQALTSGVTWLLAHRNADAGFSEDPNASNDNEIGLAMIAIRLASPGTSLSTSATYLKGRQLPDGSWGSDPYTTALAAQALFFPPVVSPIPDQTVAEPTLFTAINLDSVVTDPDNTDSQITWTASGQSLFTVTIANRVASISYPPGTRKTEQITFTATDPDGFSASTSASFTVTGVDYTIKRGTSVLDTRTITGAATDMARIASYSWNPNPLPGITYSVTGAAFLSPTAIKMDSQIGVGVGVTPGIYSFQIDFNFVDSGNVPIPGPFTGDLFNVSIQVTP